MTGSSTTMSSPNNTINVGFEGSTLFSKGYTGIPFYIKKLIEGFCNSESFSPTLYLPFKRRFKQHHLASFTNDISKKWYWNGFSFGNVHDMQIMHFTHAPFINFKGVKKVATIHDLAFMVDDIKDIEIATPYFIEKRIHLLSQISQYADAIISVSQKTKEDFLNHFDYPEEKIHVIHLAPIFNANHAPLSKNNAEKPYLLSVGGISTRKNSLNILKGFLASKASTSHILVFAGKNGLGSERFHTFYEENKLYDKVKMTGYVSDKELQSLYAGASGFVFPTLYEGFGIPILEAMNHKLPLLVGSLGASVEIANNHAHVAHPLDVSSIASGIDALIDYDQETLEAAYTYAQHFSWKKNINQTAQVYSSLLN